MGDPAGQGAQGVHFLRLPQVLLELFALGDVHQGALDDLFAGFTWDQGHVREHPYLAAVLTPQAVFEAHQPSRLTQSGQHGGPIFGVEVNGARVVGQQVLRRVVAEDPRERRIAGEEPTVQGYGADAGEVVLEQPRRAMRPTRSAIAAAAMIASHVENSTRSVPASVPIRASMNPVATTITIVAGRNARSSRARVD